VIKNSSLAKPDSLVLLLNTRKAFYEMRHRPMSHCCAGQGRWYKGLGMKKRMGRDSLIGGGKLNVYGWKVERSEENRVGN